MIVIFVASILILVASLMIIFIITLWGEAMTDLDALDRLAKGDESVVNLAAKMNILLAVAELRQFRDVRRRIEANRTALTVELSTGEYIFVEDVLDMLP